MTAVTLKAYDHGEYDRLYVMVTRELGKVTARSHGERRSSKLVAGHLSPWLLSQILLREGRAGWQINEAETSQQYGNLAGEVLGRLHVLAELIDRYSLPEEPDGALWQAVILANHLVVGDQLSRLGFVESLAKVSVAVGLSPHLETCVISGEDLSASKPIGWSSVLGGVVGPAAVAEAAGGFYRLTNATTIKLLRLAGRPARLPRLRVPEAAVIEAEWLLLDYFQVQLDRGLKSLASTSQSLIGH